MTAEEGGLHRPRRPGWNGARLEKTVTATVGAVFAAVPLGLALGAWTIFQPAEAPMVGPVPAYLVAGGLLCLAAGWYAGYRKRVAERGRTALGYWPTYVLAAFAAGAFAVWSAHLTASVHTPEASLTAGATPATSAPPTRSPVGSTVPTAEPGTCAAGVAESCSGVMLLVQNTMDGFAGNLKTTCQMIMSAAADPQRAGWTPPRQLVSDCTFWVRGGADGKGLDVQRAEAHQLFNNLAVYAGWPPPNR
ncbi:hypothetical protein AB0A74_09715 [Saccharothrix sp. NPDC042600]|uniref:hypothetical protein n=1 Tax=Saccharothrix TaxID=2071 RepID=UPI0033DA0CEF|nr:hypothetical protein GCM10017745_35810 [Saccharothrix mutabilis subsp. capreolus]